MKNFDLYLSRSIRRDPTDWTEHYIHYTFLKNKLKAFAKRRKVLRKQQRGDIEFSSLSPSNAAALGTTDEGYFNVQEYEENPDESMRKLAVVERNEFVAAVELELSKCGPFVQEQWSNLRQSLSMLSSSEAGMDINDVAKETLETFHFMMVNILTLRQILLRYDAFRRTFQTEGGGGIIQEWDLMRREKNSEANNITALFNFEPLSQMESTLTLYFMSRQMHDALSKFSTEYHQFRTLLDSSLQSVERAAGGHMVMRDVVANTIRQYFLIGSARFGLPLEPSLLHCKGRHLKTEMKALSKWRKTSVLPADDVSVDGDKAPSEKYKLDPKNVWPLVLNLISCFLFMMNNYIIEPSSAYYANALGSSDALSGIMIGAAPWFALVSAVGYSFWTNQSYKQPILFAGVLMMIGNLLYASAYSFKSMELCLIGRAISGLGAPRVINRRYVADATPFRLRTAASAAFAMATALGAALGPGMAIVLDAMTEFEFSLPLLGPQYFNGMTGPGYFMALMWGVYTLAIVFTFSEPNRSGLDELREREGGDAVSVALSADDTDFEEDALSHNSSMEFSKDGRSVGSANTTEVSSNSPMYCIKHMTRAAALCMLVIFMKRIALEAIVGSTSIVTKNRYNWNITNVGTLHLVNGIVVIPVSILAGWLSQFHEDRYLAIWLIAVTICGMLFMIDVTDLMDHDSNESYNEDLPLSVGPARYITGSLIAFSGIEACESFVASLMSKVVPSALAVGTFNSGLLATLVGTSGRATGDLFITLMALISIRNLLNLLIIPGIVLMIISTILIRRNYSILAV